MKTIFKYALPSEHGKHTVRLPVGARILSVGAQDALTLWAEVDSNAPTEKREIFVAWTGWSCPEVEGAAFLGTAQSGLVFHVFDLGKLVN